MLAYLFVLAVGLIAGTISGIVGTGSSIMLIPVLAYEFGPQEAVPIMAVAAVMANLSRIVAWWRDVDWRACAAYSIPGIPAGSIIAMVPVLLAAKLPVEGIGILIGVDTIPDMFRTTTNVTGTMTVATILGAGEERRTKEIPPP